MTVQSKISEVLRAAGAPLTAHEVVRRTGCGYTVVVQRLGAMVAEGMATRPERGKYALATSQEPAEALAGVLEAALRGLYPGAAPDAWLFKTCRATLPGVTLEDVRGALNALAAAGKATFLFMLDGEPPAWSAPLPGRPCHGIPRYDAPPATPTLAHLLS